MNPIASPRFLPAVLWIDAASAAVIGMLQIAAAARLAGWLGLPAGLLSASGLALLPVAAWAAWTARSRPVSRPAVLVLVGVNAAWVLGCLELLLTGAAGTLFGAAWLVWQAVAVGGLALLEWLGLRRAQPAAWA
jgi:cation transport ATPase